MKALLNLIMLLVGKILGKKAGAAIQGGSKGPVDDIMGQVLGKLFKDMSLKDILAKFEGAGMKEKVASWVGSGPNQVVSAEQVTSALGSDHIEDLARQLGLPSKKVSGLLAEQLPEHVNQLTPNGTLPN